MIMPSDADYQETKRLKISGAQLRSPFKEVADWISAHYQVHVLNVYYDTVIPDDRPRLSVILEFQEDALKFRHGELGNFDRAKQDRVRQHFEALLLQQGNDRFKVDGLFVVFSAFESVARIEANESVTEREIASLKQRLGNADLWEISHCFDRVTFFFYTDAQVRKYEKMGLRGPYGEEYARVLESHDQFGYLKKRGVSVYFDSKDNFDVNYQGNWYYYYK